VSERKNQAWEFARSKLTRATANALDGDEPACLAVESDEPAETFAVASAKLTASAQAEITLKSTTEATGPPPGLAMRYCLLVCPDGEAPRIYALKTPEGAARKLGSLEGADAFVAPFYGLPLGFTVGGPERHLLLPGGDAVTVPLYEGAPVRRLEKSPLAEQANGYVGPAAFSTEVDMSMISPTDEA
jgi:hypothetical protein